MKGDYLNRKAKKIRNKLIYYIHIELKKKSKNNHLLLINSMTPKELNNKYRKCSDYCIEKIETYSSSQMNNGIDNNNYFHVSLTYSSINNNYHMLIDNKNIEQIIGENNIIGKYYKGNHVHIRTTTNKKNYNINDINGKENKLEKLIIGDKKFTQKKKITYSSLNIKKNIVLNDSEKNFNNKLLNNLNTNENNYKKIINLNSNEKIIQTNCEKKIKIYSRKLKRYCASLIIIKKRRETNNIHKIKNSKNLELISPAISEHKKNFKKERNYLLKNEKEKPKMNNIYTNRENHNLICQTENHYKIQNIHSKIKSQTKISLHLFSIPEKKNFHRKNRAQSINIDNIFVEKITSSKKVSPKKKNTSPKKLINSMKVNNVLASNTMQKHHKKGKNTDSNIRNFIHGSFINKKKMFNPNNNNNDSNKYTNNVYSILNTFRNSAESNKKFDKKKFKRANTGINKKYHFRGNEIKSKENNV